MVSFKLSKNQLAMAVLLGIIVIGFVSFFMQFLFFRKNAVTSKSEVFQITTKDESKNFNYGVNEKKLDLFKDLIPVLSTEPAVEILLVDEPQSFRMAALSPSRETIVYATMEVLQPEEKKIV